MKTTIKAFGAAVLMLSITACEKEMKNDDIQSYDDVIDTQLEQRDFEIEDEIGGEVCSSYEFVQYFPEGVEVIDTSEYYPKSILIDYGTGVVDQYGRVKSGQIIIEISADMKAKGALKTITTENFKINDRFVEAERRVENLGKNTDGNIEFSVTGNRSISSELILRTKTYSRVKEWIAGSETCDRSDDEFLILGSSEIKTNNRTISTEIITPIHRAIGECIYPISGEVQITRKNGRISVLDFGSGDCDAEAELTLHNGEVRIVDLHKRQCRR